MKIAVAGATGTAGAHTTTVAKEQGHEVVEISRSRGIDLHTGAGLGAALIGVDVVIDTSDPVPTRAGQDLIATMVNATRRLVDASKAAKVAHFIYLSIENIDKPELDGFPYYLAERAQEKVVRAAIAWVPQGVVRPGGRPSPGASACGSPPPLSITDGEPPR
jgi:nucleoside-diphosphate-sugar epimerase